MKYLQNGLKNSKQIIIHDQDSLSQLQSDISQINDVPPTLPHLKSPINKFRMITPIRRTIKPPPKQKKGKIQQIQINDSNSSYPQKNYISAPVHNYLPPEQVFKKKLVKVSNKCKIQGKQYSSTECSICLTSLQNKNINQIGRLDCKHSFCFECIIESAKFSSRCPYCRASFSFVNRNEELVPIQQKDYEDNFDPYDEPCYVCGRNDDFDHLLECQYCEAAFCHTYCDNRLQSQIPPQESWYCLSCSGLMGNL